MTSYDSRWLAGLPPTVLKAVTDLVPEPVVIWSDLEVQPHGNRVSGHWIALTEHLLLVVAFMDQLTGYGFGGRLRPGSIEVEIVGRRRIASLQWEDSTQEADAATVVALGHRVSLPLSAGSAPGRALLAHLLEDLRH